MWTRWPSAGLDIGWLRGSLCTSHFPSEDSVLDESESHASREALELPIQQVTLFIPIIFANDKCRDRLVTKYAEANGQNVEMVLDGVLEARLAEVRDAIEHAANKLA